MISGSIHTEAQLEFSYDPVSTRTSLSKRRAGGLCSISKPYWDKATEVLGLQLVNPTAGLFSGDHLSIDIKINDYAKAAVTSPSATRFHTMPDANTRATITQSFHVGHEAWLDYWPEIVIPQRDSDVIQVTKINLAKDASMVFLDSLAPGRLAHGENYQFRRFETVLEIHQDDTLVAKERCVLSPASGRWPLDVPEWEACYYGAIWIADANASNIVEDLQNTNDIEATTLSHYGASLLSAELGVIRIISPSSLLLRKSLSHFRDVIQDRLPKLKMSFRKI